MAKRKKRRRLPELLRPLFWEYDFWRLSWAEDRDLVIAKVLARGNWDQLCWLLGRVTRQGLRDWLEHREGAGLSSRQLRFWEATLHLPHTMVNQWLAQPDHQIWEGR